MENMFLSNPGRLSVLSVLFFVLFLFTLPAPVWSASFSLSPASAIKSVGDVFSVDIVLDTGTDAVSGATAILRYDITKLQVQDDDGAAAGIQIKQGAIFNQTPLTNSVDTTAGQVRYDSGSLGSSYTGRGTMATIRFRAMTTGAATVSYVFDPNSTTDTSLVAAASGPTNLLTTVQDGTYTISTASATTTTTPVLLPTGAVENTLMVLVGGIIFIALGLFFAR